jgi:hypothetical protein
MQWRRLALLAVVVLAGCGEKSEPTAPAPRAGASQAGEGGDEEPIRQRVPITVGRKAIKPARSQVDAFLGIRLVVRNASGRAQRIEVRGAKTPNSLAVAKGERGTLDLEGLRPGSYRIQAKPANATLVVKRTVP